MSVKETEDTKLAKENEIDWMNSSQDSLSTRSYMVSGCHKRMNMVFLIRHAFTRLGLEADADTIRCLSLRLLIKIARYTRRDGNQAGNAIDGEYTRLHAEREFSVCAPNFLSGATDVAAPAIRDPYVTMTNTAKFFELGLLTEDYLRRGISFRPPSHLQNSRCL